MRPLTLKLFLMDLASKLQQHVFPCVAISVNLEIQKVEVGGARALWRLSSGERDSHMWEKEIRVSLCQ